MAVNRFRARRIKPLGNRDTLRVTIVTAALFLRVAGGAETPPAFRWIQEVDNSGLAYPFAGLGTDAKGNTYVAGSTKSLNFPVKNAVQNHSASPGSYDVFVTKFDPSGNIVYSTYFGGSADDVTRAVAVDAAGDIYVVGTTASLDFPTTHGSWSPSMPPGPEPTALVPGSAYEGAIFLFKLNPNGSLAYST
jgi:Beta-propeller repeat